MFRADASAEQDGLCFYCKEPLTSATISADHGHPRAKGGQTTRKNIRAACRACNVAKGKMLTGEFMKAIKAPKTGAPFAIWMAYMRRRIWARAHRACDRIEKRSR
jgi:5-methylcytosine-specific restriction endonuclease McrA